MTTALDLNMERLRALAQPVVLLRAELTERDQRELATEALALLALVADLQRDRDAASSAHSAVTRALIEEDAPGWRDRAEVAEARVADLQRERDEALSMLDDMTAGAAPDDQLAAALSFVATSWEAAEARAERAERALRIARPYVYNVMCEHRDDWRGETARNSLAAVDAALAGGREEPREEPAA